MQLVAALTGLDSDTSSVALNWPSAFAVEELESLLRDCMALGMWEQSTFLMQLIWSSNTQAVMPGDCLKIFTAERDYASVLSLPDASGRFSIERCVYHLLTQKMTNYADSAIRSCTMETTTSAMDHVFVDIHDKRLDPGTAEMLPSFCLSF
jgi:hypothetical protein